jgi:hypothetical protein
MTPRAAPKDSRFMIDASSGMSRLRSTTASKRKPSPTTTGYELGHLRGEEVREVPL